MPSRDPRKLFSMEETMLTLHPPARRTSGFLIWIAAAFIAVPLALMIARELIKEIIKRDTQTRLPG